MRLSRMRWPASPAVLLLAAVASASVACAFDVRLSQSDGLLQTCSGMWAGKNTSISISFLQPDSNAKVAVVLYEWADFFRLGARSPSSAVDAFGNPLFVRTEYICNSDAVARQLCAPADMGNWIAPNNGTFSRHLVSVSPQQQPEPIHYPVTKKGYYCVGAVSVARADGDPGAADPDRTAPFMGLAHFENTFNGALPAAEYPKVLFYFWLTVAYALLAGAWGYLCFVHRDELLPIQHMISAVMVFLVINTAIQWGYLRYQNTHAIDYWHMRAVLPGHAGETAALRALLAVTALMDAAKTTISLFLLLVVSLGYGVVRPSLGPVMRRVQLLALAHFISGILYTVGIIMLLTESSATWPIVFILPLALTLAVFLLWILHALTTTIATLERRHQTFKQQVFTRLHWLLKGTAVSIMLYFVVAGICFGQAGGEFGPGTWTWRWFVLDGWLSILYLAVFLGVAYLWRPTGQNLRLSMSDEVATDDTGVPDDYEIGEFAQQPDDADADAEEGDSHPHTPQQSNSNQHGFFTGVFGALHRAAEQQAGLDGARGQAAQAGRQPASPAAPQFPSSTEQPPPPPQPSPPPPPLSQPDPVASSSVLHDSGDAFTIGGEDEEEAQMGVGAGTGAGAGAGKNHFQGDDSSTIHVTHERGYEGTAAERKGLFASSDDEDEDDDDFSDIGKDVPGTTESKSKAD